ncbi:MAG: tyrosine-type recombinase/integrase [Actinomycetota bacterium]|nr:tyrosine-type recombinase/integrase [Actinomycetota bacterium]
MARRGRGGGSTPRLKQDGRWEASWYDRRGKRHWVTAKTRRECQQKLRQAITRRDAGYDTDRITVGGWIERWADSLGPPRHRPATIRAYRYRVSLLPDWFRQLPLWELDALDVERMLADLLATHATSTVAAIRSALRQSLNAAEKSGRAPRNAARLSDPIRVEEQEVVPFTLDEARRFLEALEGDRLASLYLVALSCGVRQGEAIGLKWDRVDLDRPAMHIVEQQTPYGPGPPKARRRTVLLPGVCVTALERWRRRQLEERLRLGPAYEDWGLVWPDKRGRPLVDSTLRRHFHRIREKAGLRHVRFHDMRHSAASLLLAQGVPARVVMEVLGHSAAAMFLRYSHVSRELAEEAAQAMDDLFGGRDGGR